MDNLKTKLDGYHQEDAKKKLPAKEIDDMNTAQRAYDEAKIAYDAAKADLDTAERADNAIDYARLVAATANVVAAEAA